MGFGWGGIVADMRSLALWLLVFVLSGWRSWGAQSALGGREGALWDRAGRLPDFSYAGYHRGEEAIPDLPRGVSVLEFGAVPDDGEDDTEAFRVAIEASGGRAIEIPAGRYVIRDILEVSRPGVVFRGAGRGRTILYFPRPLEEVRSNLGATTGGRPTSNYSWSGGFIWFKGATGSRVVGRVSGEGARGSNGLEVEDGSRLEVGQEVELVVRDDEDNSLARHLYAEDPGSMDELRGRVRVSMVARVVGLEGRRVELDRRLRFDVRPAWRPELREFKPSVSECGVEDLTFEFPETPYGGHFTELGYNPVAMSGVAHCWVRRVAFVNADSGPMVSGVFNTLEDLVYESSREPDGGGHVGHHGTYVGGSDNLFTRFDIRCRFIHDLTVSRCIGNVFSEGRGVDLCLDHHKHAPVANLFTDLDAGAGTRLWRCGGGADLGRNCGAWGTFWNIRAEAELRWPPVGFGPDCMNLVGVGRGGEAVKDLGGRWFEPFAPGDLEPANLHRAQLDWRLRQGSRGGHTRVGIRAGRWLVGGEALFRGTAMEGLLPNVRMVNATFEDQHREDFDVEGNTGAFLAALPDYVAAGVRAVTLNLQGGMPGYEGALNSAFAGDGSLRLDYLRRVERVIEACDRAGVVVILGCFYQRQDQVLADGVAVRRGVVEVVRWLRGRGYTNVVLEIANEFDHGGFDHDVLRSIAGQAELIGLVRREAPGLLVSTSGLGHGGYPGELAELVDFMLIHFNGVAVGEIAGRVEALRKYGKPIVCNEDDKVGAGAVAALRASVGAGASYGLMLKEVNQFEPFSFRGRQDDEEYYHALSVLCGLESN